MKITGRRFVFWLVTVPLTVLVLDFVVSNRDHITLQLFPLPFDMTLPTSLWTMVVLFVGFVLGALVAWTGEFRRRRVARQQARRLAEIERELTAARRRAAEAERALKQGGQELVPGRTVSPPPALIPS